MNQADTKNLSVLAEMFFDAIEQRFPDFSQEIKFVFEPYDVEDDDVMFVMWKGDEDNERPVVVITGWEECAMESTGAAPECEDTKVLISVMRDWVEVLDAVTEWNFAPAVADAIFKVMTDKYNN
jgi:hypothetical protein